jgi:uncharacterized iron-regulated membrane protein
MSDLISCRTCKKNVAISASKCPHCGEQHVHLMNWTEMLGCWGAIIGFFVIFGGLAWLYVLIKN